MTKQATPEYDARILVGNALDRLRALPDNSVDSIVTDPPYGLADLPAEKVAEVLALWVTTDRGAMPTGKGFMGKSWDAFTPPPALFDECFRVLKPGGYLLAFSGSRTVDLMGIAIRLAGFEVRDTVHWTYGSGFPKSLNVGKALQAQATTGSSSPTAQRQAAMGKDYKPSPLAGTPGYGTSGNFANPDTQGGDLAITDATAKEWEGWGTALKPSHEPITVARKPLAGTVVQNVLAYGTGALNLDGCRVEAAEGDVFGGGAAGSSGFAGGYEKGSGFAASTQGRFPPNTLLTHSATCVRTGTKSVKSDSHHPASRGAGGVSTTGHGGQEELVERKPGTETVASYTCAPDCPVALMDRQSGTNRGALAPVKSGHSGKSRGIYGDYAQRGDDGATFRADSGGASRFFPVSEWSAADLLPFCYVAKASKSERNAGLAGMPEKRPDTRTEKAMGTYTEKGVAKQSNHHPTVKPVAIMAWLARAVTRPGGTVLDPFLGSGTTAVAAILEGFEFIGCELTEEYLPIIDARIEWATQERAKRTGTPAKERKKIPLGQVPVIPVQRVAPEVETAQEALF